MNSTRVKALAAAFVAITAVTLGVDHLASASVPGSISRSTVRPEGKLHQIGGVVPRQVDMNLVTSSLSTVGITYQQTISPVSESDQQAATSAALESFGALIAGQPDVIKNVNFTDVYLGQETQDGSGNTITTPDYISKAAIMIVFSGQNIPAMGPSSRTPPAAAPSIFVAFVSRTTGDVVDAVSFPETGAEK